MRVDDYLGKARDSVAETQLARALRELPEAEAFLFITAYIEREYFVGLILARRVLRDPKHFEQILARGFEVANVSSIRDWVELGIARLGARRVLAMFETFAKSHARAASGFCYWVGILLYKADPSLRARFKALEAQTEQEARGAAR